MEGIERSFRFSVPLTKATQTDNGDWLFEGMASMPGRDIEGEEILPEGLDIDFLLGKGLPEGAGGYINYDHDPSTIVGVPLEGRITPQGLWLKWKGLKTKFMDKIVDQMRALKETGLRRYGMSVEGVVKQYDPSQRRILRAFIRNVALTPTPVHPGTWVDFAKSLTKDTVLEYSPHYGQPEALRKWVQTVGGIVRGELILKSNPYFSADGTFTRDGDVLFFRDVCGLDGFSALEVARYALSRQNDLVKALKTAFREREVVKL